MAAPIYGNVDYITEAVAVSAIVTEVVAPAMIAEFVGAPAQYTTQSVTTAFTEQDELASGLQERAPPNMPLTGQMRKPVFDTVSLRRIRRRCRQWERA